MFARIVREYPLSDRADAAKKRLEQMELPVPQVDRVAYDREKYEEENYKRPSLLARSTEWLRSGPDLSHAAKSGQPTMTDPKRTIPASVPVVNTTETASAATPGGGTTDVTAQQVGNNSALDKSPDARTTAGTAQTTTNQTAQPLPSNRDKELKQYREKQAKKQAKAEKKKKKKQEQKDQNTNQAQPASNIPGAAGALATPATAPQQQ
jgi:outer membrane protein assembly factor BamD